MQTTGTSVIEKEINGCQITLSFAEQPVEGVIEKMQSILSCAYDERVQQDLIKLTNQK